MCEYLCTNICVVSNNSDLVRVGRVRSVITSGRVSCLISVLSRDELLFLFSADYSII